jgi:hypothetical protein
MDPEDSVMMEMSERGHNRTATYPCPAGTGVGHHPFITVELVHVP